MQRGLRTGPNRASFSEWFNTVLTHGSVNTSGPGPEFRSAGVGVVESGEVGWELFGIDETLSLQHLPRIIASVPHEGERDAMASSSSFSRTSARLTIRNIE